jgi:hypothetical protein
MVNANQNKLETRDIGSMPGPGSGKLNGQVDLSSYSVKYMKADIDDAAAMLELSTIETRAIHAKPGDEDVVLLEKDKFTFMDKYFIILKYLERT